MTPLKFCMVTTFYPPYNFGGDGIYVHRLAHALADQGHDVHVVHDVDAFAALSARPPAGNYPRHPNITLHPLGGGNLGKADLLLTHQLGRPVLKHRQLKALLEGEQFDVIHYHNISLLGGPAVLRYGRALKLCTLHEYWLVCPMHVLWRFDREACTRRTCLRCTLAGHRPPQLWRYTGAVDRAIREVDAFVAASQFVRAEYARQGFRAPIRHLPLFLPETENRDGDADAYRHPRPYFLFVGRLEKIKGLHILLERFRDYRAADLVIAGTGTYESELRALAHDLPHVHFLGWRDHRQLKELYRQAIAAVVPSICYETFGLAPIEAFAARTPAIVHAMGALPEVVQDSGGGLVYRNDEELLDALEALRTQPELRRRLGERGYRSYREHYTEARHLGRYFALIDELRSGRGEGEAACLSVSR